MSDETDIRKMLGAANDAEPKIPKYSLADLEAAGGRVIRGHESDDGQKISFLHLLVGPGTVTLAYMRDPIRSARVFVGMAWCSPNDQWDRKRGNLIAERRCGHVAHLALLHLDYRGLGFIFACGDGGTHHLDKETFEAFEAWLAGRSPALPMWLTKWEWLQRTIAQADSAHIPVTIRRSLRKPEGE